MPYGVVFNSKATPAIMAGVALLLRVFDFIGPSIV
jgi:hypothetical protein